ncbi:MAG: cob(I)alamin adenosyltransferase [Arenicella sp.]|jgi:cob(I)alamin adenosyltransferase
MIESTKTPEQELHRQKMQAHKQKVDAHIAAANIERGVAILLTGNGKGKTSSAFGMVLRALGYDQKIGIVQFLKGAQGCGEADFIRANCPKVEFHQMGSGFTWNSQDKDSDIRAALAVWQYAEAMLSDPSYDLVVLDELTYMFAYKYLDRPTMLDAIQNRPRAQTVVVTGRGGGRELREIMDTISEVKDIRHAYQAGIKARKGVDY